MEKPAYPIEAFVRTVPGFFVLLVLVLLSVATVQTWSVTPHDLAWMSVWSQELVGLAVSLLTLELALQTWRRRPA
ncbi:MAG: hypothetical protein ACYDCK_01380 [Thermoplasmatota archaeon]